MTQSRKQFTDDQLEALRKRVLDYKETKELSWAELNKKTGIATATLQAFATGKYAGNNQTVATEVERWFTSEDAVDLFGGDDIAAPFFQKTKTAQRIRATLAWARRGNLCTIMGNPGVGKTQSIDAFRREHPNVWSVTAAPSRASFNAIMLAILDEFNVPAGKRSAYQLSELVRRQFRSRDNAVLILDEAQHLGEKALEELRSIYDDTKVGMVFAGNLEVTRNIEGSRTANYAQRFSRVSMRQVILSPEPEDVSLLLDAWGCQDPKQRALATEIAMKPGGGALRSMSKVLELAHVIARDVDGVAEVTLSHVKDAWAQLSSGGVA